MALRTRAAAMMVPMRVGHSVMRRSAVHPVFRMALARSAGARSELISLFRVRVSMSRLPPLVGTWMPIPAPW